MMKTEPELFESPCAKGITGFLEQKKSLRKLQQSPLVFRPYAVVITDFLGKSKLFRLHRNTGKCMGIPPTHCPFRKLKYKRKKASAASALIHSPAIADCTSYLILVYFLWKETPSFHSNSSRSERTPSLLSLMSWNPNILGQSDNF